MAMLLFRWPCFFKWLFWVGEQSLCVWTLRAIAKSCLLPPRVTSLTRFREDAGVSISMRWLWNISLAFTGAKAKENISLLTLWRIALVLKAGKRIWTFQHSLLKKTASGQKALWRMSTIGLRRDCSCWRLPEWLQEFGFRIYGLT